MSFKKKSWKIFYLTCFVVGITNSLFFEFVQSWKKWRKLVFGKMKNLKSSKDESNRALQEKVALPWHQNYVVARFHVHYHKIQSRTIKTHHFWFNFQASFMSNFSTPSRFFYFFLLCEASGGEVENFFSIFNKLRQVTMVSLSLNIKWKIKHAIFSLLFCALSLPELTRLHQPSICWG